MEELPGKERLLAMPPYQKPDLNDIERLRRLARTVAKLAPDVDDEG